MSSTSLRNWSTARGQVWSGGLCQVPPVDYAGAFALRDGRVEGPRASVRPGLTEKAGNRSAHVRVDRAVVRARPLTLPSNLHAPCFCGLSRAEDPPSLAQAGRSFGSGALSLRPATAPVSACDRSPSGPPCLECSARCWLHCAGAPLAGLAGELPRLAQPGRRGPCVRWGGEPMLLHLQALCFPRGEGPHGSCS